MCPEHAKFVESFAIHGRSTSNRIDNFEETSSHVVHIYGNTAFQTFQNIWLNLIFLCTLFVLYLLCHIYIYLINLFFNFSDISLIFSRKWPWTIFSRYSNFRRPYFCWSTRTNFIYLPVPRYIQIYHAIILSLTFVKYHIVFAHIFLTKLFKTSTKFLHCKEFIFF